MNQECAMYLNATRGRFNKDKSTIVEKGIKVAYEVMCEINAKTGIAMEKFDKLVEMEDGDLSVAIAVYGQILTKEQIATIKGIMEGKGLSKVEELVIEGEEEDTKFYSVLKESVDVKEAIRKIAKLAHRPYCAKNYLELQKAIDELKNEI